MSDTTFESLGALFSNIEMEIDAELADKEKNALKQILRSNPTDLTNREIEVLHDFGIANATYFLSESATDSTNQKLLQDIASLAMDKAFVMWEMDPAKYFTNYYLEVLKNLCEKRIKQGRSDEVMIKVGQQHILEYASQRGVVLDQGVCKSMAHELLFKVVEEGKNSGETLSNKVLKSRLFCKAEEEVDALLLEMKNDGSCMDAVHKEDHHKQSNNIKSSRITSLTNGEQIDSEIYSELLAYAKANVSRFSIASKQENPSDAEITEMATEAIANTIIKFDKDIAESTGAKFTTYLIWNIRTVISNRRRFLYADRLKKNSSALDENNSNLDFSPKEIKEIQNGGYLDPDVTGADVERERVRKLQFGMRQIRHELPRKINHYIDLKMGEILKSDGTPFSTRAYCEMIGIDRKIAEKIQADGLRIIKSKMIRKGFIEIIESDEASVEDMQKSSQIATAVLAEDEANTIMQSIDINDVVNTKSVVDFQENKEQ